MKLRKGTVWTAPLVLGCAEAAALEDPAPESVEATAGPVSEGAGSEMEKHAHLRSQTKCAGARISQRIILKSERSNYRESGNAA